MTKILSKRNVAAVVGALVLGVLGNGLWELIKPGLSWVTSGVLDLATFGLSSLRDEMYRDIAMGQFERASLAFLNYLSGFFCGLFLVVGIRILKRDRSANEGSQLEKGPTKEDIDNTEVPVWFRRTFGLLAIGGAAFLLINTFRITYIVRASAHMAQLILIADPYVSESERLLNRADFAAIRNGKDYVVLESRLSAIALKNKRHVPTFGVY